MLMKHNKCVNFWSENFDRHSIKYSTPGGERESHDWGWTGRSRERTPEELAEIERRRKETDLRLKARKIHQALEIIAAVHELLPGLGEKLSPMVITALGNMSEQAVSTLKLIEKK